MEGKMIYKDFQGMKLSALGFGGMRLPVIDGQDSKIDEAAATEMVDLAMKSGINYYDTAWGYHEGNSELVLGKALPKYERSSFCLADKFPGYDLENMDKVESIFEKQLEKCRVDYFDFYLFHNVCELNIEQYLDEKYGIFKYLTEQKSKGRIKHLGFSVHGSYDVMMRFLNAYGKHMEFCQIQLNYLDWDFQDARAKVEELKKWGIPVWVMEPLRGGSLCKLSAEDSEKLQQARPGSLPIHWAFDFIQSVENVGVTLSGMSNIDQLTENIKIFENIKPLNEDEKALLLEIAKDMTKKTALPCTACRYCTSHCPQGLDIPHLIALYNEHCFTGGGFLAPMALSALPDDKKPSACIGCRSCEAVCPQQIKISEVMSDFTSRL